MVATQRTDEHFKDKHAAILEMIKTKTIGTVFFGDSLIRRWEDNPTVWHNLYHRWAAVNFGVGGDTLENMKWRLLNGELENISPRVLLFLGGTNNLPTQSADTVSKGIIELILLIKNRLPDTNILLLALLPRRGDGEHGPYDDKIERVNQTLKEWSVAHHVTYLDVGKHLATADGLLNADYTDDGLHLNSAGYEAVGPFLAEAIEELYRDSEEDRGYLDARTQDQR